MGSAGVCGLVAVVPLHAHAVSEHAQMAVGIDKAGLDMASVGVKHLPLPILGALLHGAHLGDLVPPDGHISSGDGQSVHGVDGSIDNQHRFPFPGGGIRPPSR